MINHLHEHHFSLYYNNISYLYILSSIQCEVCRHETKENLQSFLTSS